VEVGSPWPRARPRARRADWRLPPHQGLSAGRAGSPATL